METSNLVILCREKLNFTQEKLAKLLNKKQSTIARYESGGITPPGDIILKIQELLNPNQGEKHE